MRILHIHPSMAIGGIEAMICALANEMSKTEDVTVCSIFEPNQSSLFWHQLSPSVDKYSIGKKKPGFSFKVLYDIYRFIKNGKFDVVNLHGMFYYYILTVFFLHSRIRFFYTVHSDAVKENSIWDKRIFIFKKFCFNRKWLRPITISKVSQDSFLKLYSSDSDLIFNGVPEPIISNEKLVEKYKISEHTTIFIHAGRISEPKNQFVLCKIFNRLINEGNDVVLLIAGENQDEKIFERIMPFFSDRIIYLGVRNDIPNLMANSDAMCLPSLWEGLPVVLLEALSVGCIPICSNVSGISNVVTSGDNGWLSNTSSEDDYYEALKTFLSMSKTEYNIMRKRCVSSFANYNILNTSKTYLQLYKSTKK